MIDSKDVRCKTFMAMPNGNFIVVCLNTNNVMIYKSNFNLLKVFEAKMGPGTDGNVIMKMPLFRTTGDCTRLLWNKGNFHFAVIDTYDASCREFSNFWMEKGKPIHPILTVANKDGNKIWGIGNDPQRKCTVVVYWRFKEQTEKKDIDTCKKFDECLDEIECHEVNHERSVVFIGGSSKDLQGVVLVMAMNRNLEYQTVKKFQAAQKITRIRRIAGTDILMMGGASCVMLCTYFADKKALEPFYTLSSDIGKGFVEDMLYSCNHLLIIDPESTQIVDVKGSTSFSPVTHNSNEYPGLPALAAASVDIESIRGLASKLAGEGNERKVSMMSLMSKGSFDGKPDEPIPPKKQLFEGTSDEVIHKINLHSILSVDLAETPTRVAYDSTNDLLYVGEGEKVRSYKIMGEMAVSGQEMSGSRVHTVECIGQYIIAQEFETCTMRAFKHGKDHQILTGVSRKGVPLGNSLSNPSSVREDVPSEEQIRRESKGIHLGECPRHSLLGRVTRFQSVLDEQQHVGNEGRHFCS